MIAPGVCGLDGERNARVTKAACLVVDLFAWPSRG